MKIKFKKNQFGLCILDVMLPFKDGFTLGKEIREIDKDVPLFFLTAKTLKDDMLKGAISSMNSNEDVTHRLKVASEQLNIYKNAFMQKK